MGLTPQRAAKDASVFSRSGLSPMAIRRVTALSGPMPTGSSSCGAWCSTSSGEGGEGSQAEGEPRSGGLGPSLEFVGGEFLADRPLESAVAHRSAGSDDHADVPVGVYSDGSAPPPRGGGCTQVVVPNGAPGDMHGAIADMGRATR